MTVAALNKELGNIDIYLLDAILKGYVDPAGRVLDAGCGEGRNLHWLLKQGYECWGVDANPLAITLLRRLAAQLQQPAEPERFQEGLVEKLLFPPAAFATVICNAVLHFAATEAQFRSQFAEVSRVLAPGGLLFIRTLTDWGLSTIDPEIPEDTHLPESGSRFLLNEELLYDLMQEHGLSFKEAPKTVLLPRTRSMGVLLLTKL